MTVHEFGTGNEKAVVLMTKSGSTYGWGVAEYSTPVKFFGEDFTSRVYQKSPEESYRRIFDHLRPLFPDTDENTIRKMLK